MINTMDEVYNKEEDFFKIKNKVQEKILKADNGIDNNILKKIYDAALEQGNQNLAKDLHEAMYDNRASQRLKHAERMSSSYGEYFDRKSFEEKIKSEGDIISAPNITEKSKVFDDAPHFTVGMRDINMRNDSKSRESYLEKVDLLSKEMEYQLSFANQREAHMSKTLLAAKSFFGEDLYEKYKNEPLVKDNILEVEDKFRQTKKEVNDKILNSESKYDNNILKKIYDKSIKIGDTDLAKDLHEVMYENRASQRIKQAERISNTLNESFNRKPFEEKVKSEGDIIEPKNETRKSSVFDDSPHFTVGMRSLSKDSDTEKYKGKVEQLTKEMEHQLSFVEQREQRIVKVLDKVKKVFGEDLYKSLSNASKFNNKLSNLFSKSKDEKNPEVKKEKTLKL